MQKLFIDFEPDGKVTLDEEQSLSLIHTEPTRPRRISYCVMML